MKEQPTARGGEQYHSTGVSNTPVLPSLASQGIDKNLAKRAIGNWVIRKPNYRRLAHCCDGCCDSPIIATNSLSH